MIRKLTSGVLFLTILLVLPLILIPAPNGYAGGPEPPYEGIPAGGKVITGHLSVGLAVNPFYVTDPMMGMAASLFIGACGKMDVAIGPFYETITLSGFMEETTEEFLESYTLAGVGPPGCFTENGGEDLIITKIKKFTRVINYYYNSDTEAWVIESPYSGMGAQLTIEQYIPLP